MKRDKTRENVDYAQLKDTNNRQCDVKLIL